MGSLLKLSKERRVMPLTAQEPVWYPAPQVSEHQTPPSGSGGPKKVGYFLVMPDALHLKLNIPKNITSKHRHIERWPKGNFLQAAVGKRGTNISRV